MKWPEEPTDIHLYPVSLGAAKTLAHPRLPRRSARRGHEAPTCFDFLGHLLDDEASGRRERDVVAKGKLIRFPFHKTLDQFDFAFQPPLERQIAELATLGLRGQR